MLDRFRLLRNDVHGYGGENRHEWLEEMTRQVPLVSAMTLHNFREIAGLLHVGQRIEPTSAEHARVVQRALEKKAPFHFNKNSVADALLIELYSSAITGSDTGDQYWFVTSNYFSLPKGDHRQPHPDLTPVFAEPHARYIYEAEGLYAALADFFGEEFIELVEETEVVQEEPRTLAEILEAEQEYFVKIWYVRNLILEEKEEAGERPPLPPEIVEHIQECRERVT